MQRHEPRVGSYLVAGVLLLFFGIFLIYPAGLMLKDAFVVDGSLSLDHFRMLLRSPLHLESLRNSFFLAFATTLGTTLVVIPMAWVMTRLDFRGRGLLNALLLVPLVLPPFVGAIGLKQLFSRFGSVNLLLTQWGLQAPDHPVDWLGAGGFTGMVLLQIFALYPILFLNVSAALANVDPSLTEAACSLGARPWRLFRTVTLPLILPGYFAGAILVFIAAFTDLGTPLVFGFSRVVPVQIFDAVTDMNSNPLGFTLVVLVLLMTVALFIASKRWLGSRRYEMVSRGHVTNREQPASRLQTIAIWCLGGAWILAALLPHGAVVLQSFSLKWVMTPFPDAFTATHYQALSEHVLVASSIRNSLLYSGCSAAIDLVLGIMIAWLLTRRRLPMSGFLDLCAMLPLALPGLVLAFGYVAAFDFQISWLNPRVNPVFLLIMSYSVRRLPYIVRAAYAGFQQTSVTLEEAAANLGARPWRVLRTITLPLIMAHLIAGSVLTFAFAMLEVSDGLILAMKDGFFPITKMIYSLVGRIDPNAPSIACALGVLGMLLLGACLWIASKLLGKRLGQLFRAG